MRLVDPRIYVNLHKNYVDGKVQNKIILISELIGNFIKKVAPEIEKVQAAMNVLYDKKLGEIDRGIIEKELRSDAQAAREFLAFYTRSFGRIDHHLAMASSNADLNRFLENNGCPQTAAYEIQKDVKKYWDISYGLIWDRFWKVRNSLKHMNELLEKQVSILERFPSAGYFQGFEKHGELKKLFHAERQIFWNEVVINAQISKEEVSKVKKYYMKNKKLVREMLIAHYEIYKKGLMEDIAKSETKLRSAMVVLSYLFGAYDTISSVRKNLVKKGFSWLKSKFIEPDVRKKEEDAYVGLMDNLVSINMGDISKLIRAFG